MSEYNITWARRNNEDLEYEIEKLKFEIKKLEHEKENLEHEKEVWEFLCVLVIMVLIAILFC
jgi:hypothetical protein